MTAREFLIQVPQGITIDEVSVGHANFFSAYGHTPTMLIYYTKNGEAHTTKRDTSRQYLSMHDELFTARYERDERYDLGKDIPQETPIRKQPQQLSLWAE